MPGKRYDVFLSHHSADKPAVECLAEKLIAEGIMPFLDQWHLIPGDPWQEALEKALNESETCAVFLGSHGPGTWENEELRIALEFRARNQMSRVIPVLLPGTSMPDRADLPALLSRLTWVDFCLGLEDPEAFRRLICGIRGEQPRPLSATINSLGRAPERWDSPPYKGIEPFRVEDADFFFGRTILIQYLIDRLRGRHFWAIVGPSGSGKSSLVRAGLIPALRQGALPGSEAWGVLLFKPGRSPLRELSAHLARHLVDPDGSLSEQIERLSTELDNNYHALATELRKADRPHILLVVDQFEEAFTQTSSESERQAFFANLLDASSLTSAKVSVIIILRADFYSNVTAYPDLADRIAARQVIVTPMQEGELWEAITKPAARSGLRFEAGLVDEILREARGQTGALPLLQQALLELWKNRDGDTMTLAAYHAIRGVKGAIAGWADSAYGNLSEEQQSLARRLLVMLVQSGDRDTRRRVTQRELVFDLNHASEIMSVLESLIQSRILATDSDALTQEKVVEISHEALLREWPLLHEWIENTRASRLIFSRLQERMKLWEFFRRDSGSLLRGSELEEIEVWSRENEVSASQKEFLEASIENRRIEARLKEDLKRVSSQDILQMDFEPSGGPILGRGRPWDLAETGWSVVFAPNLDPQVRSALLPLLEHRREKATRGRIHYYQEFTYRGESTVEFLERCGARPGMMADPDRGLPYYILLVGDPEALPYRFQSELDVGYAVGRICFDLVDDYAVYARSVVRSETSWLPRSTDVVFFGTQNPNDTATHKTSLELVHPLAESFSGLRLPWKVREIIGANAQRETLSSLLGGPETPAFLFTASHGLKFSPEDARQLAYQGALVCQDWPGPDDELGVTQEDYFAAEDIADDADVHDLIAFFFADCSLGTPERDGFELRSLGKPPRIAPRAFVSRLPQKLLSHRAGGALAVIGHVDRCWTTSFERFSKGEEIGTFRQTIRRLLDGHTVGWAMEHFNQFHTSVASILANLEQDRLDLVDVDPDLYEHLRILHKDIGNFMVFGDPAVRLPGVGERP